MRILLILLVFSLFALPVFSADKHLDTLPDYHKAIRRALGMDTASSAIDNQTLDANVREAFYHIIPVLSPILKEFSFETTYKNNRYTLDTLIMQIIAVEWFNVDSIKSIIFAPKTSWYQLPVKQSKNETERYSRLPSYYDFTDSLIFLYPVPIVGGDSIRILASTKLRDFETKDTVAFIPIEFRNAVLRYATYITARSRQHPNTQLFWQEYQEAIVNTRRAYGRPVEGTTTSPN